MSDWNDKIIAEFRSNDGKVGGPFEGAHLLLLTTTGAKSGLARVSPMVYFEEREWALRDRVEGRRPDASRVVPQPRSESAGQRRKGDRARSTRSRVPRFP